MSTRQIFLSFAEGSKPSASRIKRTKGAKIRLQNWNDPQNQAKLAPLVQYR